MPTAAQKEAAAQVMEHFAEHDASHGYAQDARYGDGRGTCTVNTAIGAVKVDTGDRDCTSGVKDAYESVGISCGGATWTGDYYECMKSTGNFKFHRTSDGSNCDDGYIAQRGDAYLAHNDDWQHAAMCTCADPDMLAEFSINSFGGISGDATGDQTGRECLVREWYGGHWDWVIEVLTNGSSSGSSSASSGSASSGSQSSKASAPKSPRYRIFREGKWRPWKSEGKTAGVADADIYDIDIEGLGPNGWFQITLEGGDVLPQNKRNDGHKKKVIGVTVYYDTPDPDKTGYYEALYRVFTSAGEWLKWEHDDDDDGAGDDVHAVRRFQLKLGKCE